LDEAVLDVRRIRAYAPTGLRCAFQACETRLKAAFEIFCLRVTDDHDEQDGTVKGLEGTTGTGRKLSSGKPITAGKPEAEESLSSWVAMGHLIWCGWQ
jgi:hypothetical protein